MIAMFVRRICKRFVRFCRHRPPGLIRVILYRAAWAIIQLVFGALLFGWLALRHYTHFLVPEPPISIETLVFFAWLLVVFGILNAVICLGMWSRSWTIRRIFIAVLLVVAAFDIVQMIIDFSYLAFLIFVIDMAILYYFWIILPKYMRRIKTA
jgi:hypothetical protein